MKRAEAGSHPPWQPLTPRGVAAFATASTRRLAWVLIVFAALGGVSVAVFLESAWFPTIREAIHRLPPEGYIRGGHLAWTGESPVILAKSPWLAVTVDLHHQQAYRLPCDLQVEFSGDSVRFLSLAGYLDVGYPRRWIIVANEPELGAWWNAWEPFLITGIGLGTACGLVMTWAGLGALYAIPAGAICRFVHHNVPFGSVWKMCVMAHMPGCLLMSFALLLYSFRAIDLVQWLFVGGAHFVLGWVYVFLAIFFLPVHRLVSGRKSNPFTG